MPRYDSLRKTERDSQIVAYAEAHPDYSLEEIGQAFGIKKQRVWQILHKAKGQLGAKATVAKSA